jgi:hypothetical protein
MKLDNTQLKRIIKEELEAMLAEDPTAQKAQCPDDDIPCLEKEWKRSRTVVAGVLAKMNKNIPQGEEKFDVYDIPRDKQEADAIAKSIGYPPGTFWAPAIPEAPIAAEARNNMAAAYTKLRKAKKKRGTRDTRTTSDTSWAGLKWREVMRRLKDEYNIDGIKDKKWWKKLRRDHPARIKYRSWFKSRRGR